MSDKINKTYSMLSIIKRNFIYMDSLTVIRSYIVLYKSTVRPHLEYAIWQCVKN